MKDRILPSVLVLTCFVSAPAWSFHEGGVASCGGCHLMHDSENGIPMGFGSGEALLKGPSASDVCLSCHALDFGAVLASDPLFPPPERGGGNFAFLLEENLNDAPDGLANPIPGDTAGHNIVAPGHGLAADPNYAQSPGGSFPANALGCTACHDPHGNASFRLLRGVGPVGPGLPSFAYAAPDAEGIELSGPGESNGNHTSYRGGMTNWCGNCHGRFHDQGPAVFEHPVWRALGGGISSQYNLYDGDANPTGGSQPSAYLAAVPFEDSQNEVGSTAGPASNSRIICLTCHRAHASSAPHATRWDTNVGLLSEDGLVSGSYPIPNPYASPVQGTLCSKCHPGGAPD